MLYTAEPVRDRNWWLRTAVYWFVLAGQLPGAANWIIALLAVVPAALAVYWRDRHPWLLALVALAATWAITDIAIAAGIVVVISRAKHWPVMLGYTLAGAAGLLVPWANSVDSGITATGPDPTGNTRLLLHLLVFIALPWLIGLVRRTNRVASLERLRHEAEQRELAAGQAVSEERNRIAQEMHDVLGHKLSLITVQAGALEVNPGAGAEVVAGQAALIRTTARQALDELREILGVLGDPADPLHPQPGLAAALDLVEHNRASGMRITVQDELPPDLQLPSATGAAIHRVVQEGLTNALRHAPGAEAVLRLTMPDERRLRIELTNAAAVRRGAGPGSGRGLPGLRERVRSLGGTLSAEPTADGGYRLAADLPLAPQPQEDDR